jgi:hypothetical protein
MAMTPEAKVKKVVVTKLREVGAYFFYPRDRWLWRKRASPILSDATKETSLV